MFAVSLHYSDCITKRFLVMAWIPNYTCAHITAVFPRLEVKKILRSPFCDQLEKYSHQFV